MSRSLKIMQAFRLRMQHWSPRIRKAAYLSGLAFLPESHGEFTLVATWKERGGGEGEYRKHFTREYVFGQYARALRPQPKKRACDFRDDVVREILTQRGVM
jgi:hypothetical protein